jgi:hypothetical protein
MGTKSGDFAQRTFNSIQIPRRLRGAGGSNPRSNTVLAHEVCHGLGLFHTHVNGSIKDPSQKYTYHYGLTDPIRTDDDPTKATDNIMSYNQNRKTTWKWQWDIMHNHLKNYIDEK